MRRAIKAVRKANWRMETSKNGYMVYPPDGSRPIAIHTSDRDGHRGTPNAFAQLKRAGLQGL